MKTRLCHVTNSSSSSFIIAYREPEIDNETIKKYPLLKQYLKLFYAAMFREGDYNETTAGEVFKSKEDLDEWILDCYGYRDDTVEDILKNTTYIRDFYYLAMEYINKGYKILNKNIDYSDHFLRDLVYDLAEDNNDIIILMKQD